MVLSALGSTSDLLHNDSSQDSLPARWGEGQMDTANGGDPISDHRFSFPLRRASPLRALRGREEISSGFLAAPDYYSQARCE